jgi:hypothetical protein
MQLPLHIFQVGEMKVYREEQTRDISSGGVSFLSGDEISIGDRVDYMITLSGSNPPVRIRCLGKVLRSRKSAITAPFEVAVTMERYAFVKSDDFGDLAVSA